MKFRFNSDVLLVTGGVLIVVTIGLFAAGFGAASIWYWSTSVFGGLMMLTGAWLTPYDVEIGGGK